MEGSLKTLLAGCGALALAALWSGTAAAQYYNDGYQRQYDRRGYERPGYDRGYDRGQDRGHDRGYDRSRRDYGYGNPGRGNPINRMTIDEQKQALKNHREAQKKAIKRGYVIP